MQIYFDPAESILSLLKKSLVRLTKRQQIR